MRATLLLLALLAVLALAWGVQRRLADAGAAAGAVGPANVPVPVEAGDVTRGPITLRRTFSGTLEAGAEFVVVPKVSGRLETIEVDLGDTVTRGRTVATIDDDEFVEAVKQVEASLAVAKASHVEAKSALEIAERALGRFEQLRGEGVLSESQLDTAKADELAARARVEVTNATVSRVEAELEAARIRLSYTRVVADWSGGDDRRVVSERNVDEGSTVSSNTPLLSIVDLDPIVGVVSVPERDYAFIRAGLEATLTTDTYPGRVFAGRVTRIAPVFRRSTRQARVELLIDNADERLKPGLFVRATLELESIADAVTVPYAALTERDGRIGVFVVDEDGEHVSWRIVEVGVREAERVQVFADLTGRVVTLGQELCDDGSRVTIVTADAGTTDDDGETEAGATPVSPGDPGAPGAQ